MRRLVSSLLLLVLALLVVLPAQAKSTRVKSYFRKDGTYVRSHTRNTKSYGNSSRSSKKSSYSGGGLTSVKGYFRKDGTYVQPHVRTKADGIESNNLGYRPKSSLSNLSGLGTSEGPRTLTEAELNALLGSAGLLPESAPAPAAPVVPAKPSQGKGSVLLDYHDQFHVGRQWVEAELDEVIFIRTNLSKANFSRAWIRRADLRQAKLDGAVLTKADLTTSNLSRASLIGANCSGAVLAYTKAFKANLLDTDLTDANLEGADLESAYLQGANLTGANLAKANLKGAFYDAKTRWPEGFDPVAAGAQMSK